MTGRGLLGCRAGGTGYLEYVIVFALIAVVVGVGAHVYGEHTRDGFHREAASVGSIETAAEPVAEPANADEGAAIGALPDWRRLVDVAVALPFVLMVVAGARRWRRSRRERRDRDAERRRAERLRAAVTGDSVLVDRDLVAHQEVAQMVAVHRRGAGGARDIAAVAAD